MPTKAVSMLLVVGTGAAIAAASSFGVYQLTASASPASAGGAQPKKSPTPNAEPPPKNVTMVLSPAPTPAPTFAPGVTWRRKLMVTNPNNQAVTLRSVTAAVSDPSPGSTQGLQCSSPTDVEVRVVEGQLPIDLDKKQTTAVNVDLLMHDASHNQDDCRGKTFTFSFTATATSK